MQSQSPKPQWAQHFNIDDLTFKKLESQALLEKRTALDLALETGIINEAMATAWFRDQSGMPSLKDDFFNDAPPTHLWQNENYEKCRAAACLPVAEWEGAIYWAKISNTPTGFESLHPKVIWVIGSWAGMKNWFNIWKSSVSEPIAAPGQDKMQELLESLELKQPDDEFHFSEESVEPHQPEAVQPLTEGAEENKKQEVKTDLPVDDFSAPVGLSHAPAEAQTFDIDFTHVGIDDGLDEVQAPAPPAPVATTSAPRVSLHASTHAAKTAHAHVSVQETIPVAPVTADLDSFSFNDLMPAEPVIATTVSVPPSAAPLASPAPMPAPAPAKATGMKVTPPLPPPVPKVAPAPNLISNGALAIATLPLEQLPTLIQYATTQEDLARILMGGWQSYFKQMMVLLFQQDHLIVWWTNNQWPSPVTRGESVSLENAGVFKIVSDTAQPYHGYVASSPANDDFFRRFNNGNYPEHLTVVPVRATDRVVAMILGTCDKENGKNVQLNRLEQLASQFSASLVKLMSPKQQAS